MDANTDLQNKGLASEWAEFYIEYYECYTSVWIRLQIYQLLMCRIQTHIFDFLNGYTNDVMATLYITHSAGTINVMTTSVTTMQIFIEINKLQRPLNRT